MQNWDHLDHIFKHLNLIPKDPHGCDFGRVRNWYLDTNSKYFRQMLVLGGLVTPDMVKMFNQSVLNTAGKVKTQAEYAGSMTYLGVQVRQAIPPPAPNPTVPLTNSHITDIHKNRSPNLNHRPRRRFDYFTKAVLPSLPRNTSTSILIFIPSYFDFVRRRNHLHNTPISIGAISEETPVSSVARAR